MDGSKWRMFGIPAASVSAVLAAAVAWGQLELPRPAWYSEVVELGIQVDAAGQARHREIVELGAQVAANSQLILGDKWLRLTAQIKELEAKLRSDPQNREMIARLAVFQLQLREVNGKLK